MNFERFETHIFVFNNIIFFSKNKLQCCQLISYFCMQKITGFPTGTFFPATISVGFISVKCSAKGCQIQMLYPTYTVFLADIFLPHKIV